MWQRWVLFTNACALLTLLPTTIRAGTDGSSLPVNKYIPTQYAMIGNTLQINIEDTFKSTIEGGTIHYFIEGVESDMVTKHKLPPWIELLWSRNGNPAKRTFVLKAFCLEELCSGLTFVTLVPFWF